MDPRLPLSFLLARSPFINSLLPFPQCSPTVPKHAAIGSSKVRGHGFRSEARYARLKEELNSILAAGQPDLVMEAFLNPDYEELVAQLPRTVFVEAFRLLSPAYFIEPYKQLHVLLHSQVAKIKRCTAIRVIFDDFCTKLSSIIRIRRLAGREISLAEYTHLLDCARCLGDGLMADYIWHSMEKDRVRPDLRCYNYFMESKIWNGCYNGKEEYRLRVTPYTYYRRRTGQSRGWDNYGTAEQSLGKEIRFILEDMKKAGHEPDEATMINLLIAYARVGNVNSMKSILKDVWNIDVDAVKKGERSPVLALDRSSPLYPTGRLLKAVVHAFATNSDIPGALSIVDHISNSYGLEVPESVWLEIINGSFVLFKRRHGKDKEAKQLGQVSYGYMRHLYDTITRAPFSIKPTFEMHWYFAKAAWNVGNGKNIVAHMNLAYEILEDTRRKRQIAREIVESYLPKFGQQRIAPEILRSRGFAEAVRTYDIARLRYTQQTTMMEKLARLLSRPRHIGGVKAFPTYFSRVLVARIFEEWRDYLPDHFTYETPSGTVQIKGNTNYGVHSRLPTHDKVQVRQPMETITPFENASDTVDDDFIWAEYRNRMSCHERNHPLIRLLLRPFEQDDVLDYEEAPAHDEVETEKRRGRFPVYREPYCSPDFGRLVTDAEEDVRHIKEVVFEHAFGYFRYPELAAM
ncbi:mitochondrial ATPase expression-domain-containing protein [Aspergillus granulosus]|uniref:Mitochondrial ATPase expression-domain-containing protein n=1 Tax=Aspergillus granulosus TaxID=176169 RepID=A0ABR4I1B5_9EURO